MHVDCNDIHSTSSNQYKEAWFTFLRHGAIPYKKEFCDAAQYHTKKNSVMWHNTIQKEILRRGAIPYKKKEISLNTHQSNYNKCNLL